MSGDIRSQRPDPRIRFVAAAGRRTVDVAMVFAAVTALPPTAAAQDTGTAAAADGLIEFVHACAAEEDPLWGVSLCGPIVLVDPTSRSAVSSERDPDGRFLERGDVFVGRLPDDVMIANTAVEWGGRRWTMVMLPLSKDRFNRLRLLAHESFHRVQPQLGMPVAGPLLPHLDEPLARLWLRMELCALTRAVGCAADADARRAAGDALLFRAYRNSLTAGSDTLEAMLEANEGVAEYTGIRFAMSVTGDSAIAAAEWARQRFERQPSYVRSLGYGTGPALGLLLDRFAAGWRIRIRSDPSMAADLARALELSTGSPSESLVVARAAAYDYETVAAEEHERGSDRARRVAEYRRRLIDGPSLVLRQRELGGPFDPNTIVPLGEAGMVYPVRTFEAEWGTLEVREGGGLVASDSGTLRVAAPDAPPTPGAAVEGPGWTLRLAPGWVVRPASRPGDYELSPPAAADERAPTRSRWWYVGRGLQYTAAAAVLEACFFLNAAIAAASPDGYAGLTLILAPLAVPDEKASTTEKVCMYGGLAGLTLYNATLNEYNLTWDQVFEGNLLAWHLLFAADAVTRALTRPDKDAQHVSPDDAPRVPSEQPTGPTDRFVLHAGVVGSRASGQVPLDSGYGGKIGVGVRSGPWEGRLTLVDSAHEVREGRNVTLGDSVTALSDWEIRSIGVDARRFARSGRRIQPFATGGVSYGGSVAGGPFELPEFQGETVGGASFGLVLYN